MELTIVRNGSYFVQIEYPEIEDNAKPRHRFMSSYEQVGFHIYNQSLLTENLLVACNSGPSFSSSFFLKFTDACVLFLN